MILLYKITSKIHFHKNKVLQDNIQLNIITNKTIQSDIHFLKLIFHNKINKIFKTKNMVLLKKVQQ